MKRYNRIFIFGGTGSGKTTLAKEISNITKIPYYGLDWVVYKKPFTKKYSEKTRNLILKKISNKKKWIIEGVYAKRWIIPAIKRADFIIILLLPRHILMKRVIHRYFKNKKDKTRKETDSFINMLRLLKWCYLYKVDNFVHHKELIKECKKEYVLIKSNKEIADLQFQSFKIRHSKRCGVKP